MTPATARIRPYQAEDLAAVVRLLNELEPWKRLRYTASDWERLFAMPLQGREAFVLEADGQLAGISVLRQRFLFGDYLELLAVAVSAQGKGIGGQLLAHVEGVVFQRAKNLFVCVSDFNHQGRQFYERNGYQSVGPIPDLLITGSGEILMRKTIGPARY
jgi:ribosomal protein S18 acetylase RimI-like enzyme